MNFDKKPLLFIVDDEPAICKLVKYLFEKSDFEVREAYNGQSFLQQLAGMELPDIVLLDIMMPGISGYEVCRKIKSDDRLKKIKIVYYSALPENELKTGTEETGADDYISKNINLLDLAKKIKALFL